MPYGAILLPRPPVGDLLVDYASRLTGGDRAVMRIGPTAPPHVTLAHFDCDREQAPDVWAALQEVLPQTLPFTLTGVQFAGISPGDFYVPEGGVYCGLEALRSSELDQAHREVLKVADAFGISTLGGVGERFRPHVTLAVLHAPPRRVVLPETGLLASFPAVLAWGELGPYGTFPDTVSRL